MKDGGLRDIFRARLPLVHWQSIEVGLAGRGVPDVNACHLGIEWWIEFKQTSAWAVNLEPEQVAWLTRRARAGGRVFIAVRRVFPASTRKMATDELWLLRGADARAVKDLGLKATASVLDTWASGPSKWDWGQILSLLTASPLRDVSPPRPDCAGAPPKPSRGPPVSPPSSRPLRARIP